MVRLLKSGARVRDIELLESDFNLGFGYFLTLNGLIGGYENRTSITYWELATSLLGSSRVFDLINAIVKVRYIALCALIASVYHSNTTYSVIYRTIHCLFLRIHVYLNQIVRYAALITKLNINTQKHGV